MASIQPEKKSQVLMKCQLCEEERTIISKCVECKLLLCETCTKHHKKIENAKDHKIIDLKDIGNEQIEINYMNIPCKTHPDQMCCLYCEPCDSLICHICVAKEHKGHDLIEIKEAHKRKQENLKSTRGQIEGGLEKAIRKENQLREVKKSEKSKIQIVRNDIQSHVSTLKQEVERYGDKLLQELNLTETSLNQSIDKDLQTLSERISHLQQSANEIDDLVKSIEAIKIFQETDNMRDSTNPNNSSEVNRVYQSIKAFIPLSLDGIGELRKGEVTPWEEDKVEILEIQTYISDLNIIDHILPDQGDKLWIGSYRDGVLYHIQLQDQDFTMINKINMKVFNMARLSQNKVLLSTIESKLKLLDIETSAVTDSVYDVSPYVSIGVHITRNNQVIIGAGDNTRRMVMVLDNKGTRLAVYEHDKHNQPIFTWPRSVTSTSNGYIHVVDNDPDDDGGRVIVLDRDGHVITKYTGHPDINTDYLFRPIYIVTTPADRVIVTDLDSDALHILNNTGQLMTSITTEDKGIIDPYSLAFMDDGHLLIGCTTDVEEKDAKLHKVTIKDV